MIMELTSMLFPDSWAKLGIRLKESIKLSLRKIAPLVLFRSRIDLSYSYSYLLISHFFSINLLILAEQLFVLKYLKIQTQIMIEYVILEVIYYKIKGIVRMSYYKNEQNITFKILLIGSSGVGKSSLLLKYIKNTFTYDYQVTTGVQFYTKLVKINEKTTIKLQIWDTVGQQTFRSVVRSFYKGVSAILLVYSIDRYESFEQLSSWLKEIQQNAHKESMIWIVGSKLDLQDIRKVPKVKVQHYAKSIDAIGTMEVSAKTGQNVKQLFQKLAKTLFKKFNTSEPFRGLVQPMVADDSPIKSQSFNLTNNFANTRRNYKTNSNCC